MRPKEIAFFLTAWAVTGYGQSAPKKVSQTEAMGAAVSKVQPEYPAIARQLNITGAVELDVIIAESGTVETVTPISGNPVLTKPAVDAVKRWKFKPFQKDGAATRAEAELRFNFSK